LQRSRYSAQALQLSVTRPLVRTADVLSADQRITEGPQFGEGTVSGGHQTQNPTPQMAVTMGFGVLSHDSYTMHPRFGALSATRQNRVGQLSMIGA